MTAQRKSSTVSILEIAAKAQSKAGRENSLSQFNKTLRAKGVEPMAKEDLVEFYSSVLNLTADEIKALHYNEDMPIIVRHVAGLMFDNSTREAAIKEIREWLFGTAKNGIEIEITDHTVPVMPAYQVFQTVALTPEQFKQLEAQRQGQEAREDA